MTQGYARAESDLEYIRRLILERSAIVLDDSKDYLVHARLEPLMTRQGFGSLSELVYALRNSPPPGLMKTVVEAMTTNETSFYRDVAPFDCLQKEVIPQLLARRKAQRRLNFWCAACSSGQEPYSILLLLRDAFPELENWKLKLLATDINSAMVRRARDGIYNQIEVNRGLPAKMLIKSFERKGMRWQIRSEIRDMLEAQELNLIEAWPPMSPMDVVFMRNVLIYFDVPTKRSILTRVKTILAPDGFLFLGGAESTLGIEDSFERVDFANASCYRLR